MESSSEITYAIYSTKEDIWTENRTIELNHNSGLTEVFGINSTLVFNFYNCVFGVDVIINDVIWELNLGVPIKLITCLNIDDDPINEIVFITENKIIGMDFPTIPRPAQGDVTTTIGPVRYNDDETPIDDATINLENNDGLVFITSTDDTGTATFKIFPGGYRCVITKNGEIYVTYFYVNITENGRVYYDTPDGRIPMSSKPVPKDREPPKNLFLTFLSIIIVIIIIILLMALLFRKAFQERNTRRTIK